MLDFQAARWLIDWEVAGQAGNDHPTVMPTGVYQTADGHINIAASGNAMWMRFCEAAGAEALRDHPDFATSELRSRNRAALNAGIAEITRREPNQHWIRLLNDAGVPCGPINSIDQTFAEPQVAHLGMVKPVAHPELGDIRVVGQPINLADAPLPATFRPTPGLGEHADEILRDLGYDAAAVDDLRARKVI